MTGNSRDVEQANSVQASTARPATVALNASELFLLDAAAKDFHFHRPPFPAAFRHVRVGRATNAEGAEQYIVCGEFLATRKNSGAEWMHFATIKTSNYEQVIGLQPSDHCQQPSIVWGEHADLSAELQRRLDLQAPAR